MKMYDKLHLLKLFTSDKHRAIDDDGQPFKPSHEVYKAISEEMAKHGSLCSSKHVYQILKANRGGMYENVLRAFNITLPEAKSFEKSLDFSISEGKFDFPTTKQRKFNLVIPSQDWQELLSKKKYDGRRYTVLKQRRWTNVFAQKIYDQTKIECPFSFQRIKIYKSRDAKCYAKFEANCIECTSHLGGHLYFKPAKSSDAVFDCKLRNAPSDFRHKKRRPLRGDLRSQVASEMVDCKKTALEWRQQQASAIPLGTGVPPCIPELTTLRKAKQQELDKRLNLQCNDPIQNLLYAKCYTHPRTIKNIGLYPFHCYYWTDEQELLFKTSRKEDWECELIIDATSSLTYRLRLPNGKKSAHLFLYSCICKTKKLSFPAFHMLTAKQDAQAITDFLAQIKKRVKPPRTVVCDFGKAILIAVAHVFAECVDLQDYLKRCYQIVMSIGYPETPSCFIRLDISHFVQMICRWPCVKKSLEKAREFTVKSLCYVYKCDNFTETNKILKALLIVLLSKYIGYSVETEEKLISQKSLEKIDKRIRGEKFEEPNEEKLKIEKEKASKLDTEDDSEAQGTDDSDVQDEEDSEDLDDDLEEAHAKNTKDAENSEDDEKDSNQGSETWKTWSEKIYEKAKEKAASSTEGSVANAYFKGAAAKKIKDLMSYLPLWTGIMRSIFKRGGEIATSASVESEFSCLKTVVFRVLLRADKFILLHIDYLNEKVRLAFADSLKLQQKTIEGKGNRKTSSNSAKQKVNLSPTTSINQDPEKTEDQKLISFTESILIDGTYGDFNNDSIVDFGCGFNLFDVPQDRNDQDKQNDDEQDKECGDQEFSIQSSKCMVKSSTPLEVSIQNDSSILNKKAERDSLNEKENWRGRGNEDEKLTRKIGKKRKTKYLSPTPDWDSMNRVTQIGIPLFQNGSICEPVYLPKKNVILRATCAFDSLIQIITNAITIYESYKNITVELGIPIFKLAHKLLEKGKIDAMAYKDRARILMDISSRYPSIFKFSQTRKVCTLNTNCNAAHLSEIMFENAPSCTTTYKCSSSNCQYFSENINLTISLNLDIILLNGIQYLQNAVDDLQAKKTALKCPKCEELQQVRTMKYGPHVILDTSLLTHEAYIETLKNNLKKLKVPGSRRSSELQQIMNSAKVAGESDSLANVKISMEFLLESIPLSIVIDNKDYRIAGAISYEKDREHYKAYTWQNHW